MRSPPSGGGNSRSTGSRVSVAEQPTPGVGSTRESKTAGPLVRLKLKRQPLDVAPMSLRRIFHNDYRRAKFASDPKPECSVHIKARHKRVAPVRVETEKAQ
jgi:hypothetical protein